MKNAKNVKKQRTQQRREEARKKKNTRTLLWVGGSLLIVAALLYVFLSNLEPLPGEAVDVMSDQSHIADVNAPHEPYNSDPPTSGPHTEPIALWGVHKEVVPFEMLVHNLEDGGVVIYYSKQADAAAVTQLEKIVSGYPKHVVLAPYPEMKNPITLTAWGRMDRLDAMDQARVEKFIDAFQGIDHHK